MSEWVHGVFKDVSHDSTSWSQSCEYGDWLSAVSDCNTWTSPDNKAPEWKEIMCKIYFVMLLTDFEKQNKKEAKIISHIHLPTTALQKPHMLPFDDTCCLQFNFQPLKRVTAQYAGYHSILHEERSRLRTRFFFSYVWNVFAHFWIPHLSFLKRFKSCYWFFLNSNKFQADLHFPIKLFSDPFFLNPCNYPSARPHYEFKWRRTQIII